MLKSEYFFGRKLLKSSQRPHLPPAAGDSAPRPPRCFYSPRTIYPTCPSLLRPADYKTVCEERMRWLLRSRM